MEEADWQINKSTLECMKYILQNGIHSDVKFKVGENQDIIKAHKIILRMRSPVFETMFNGSFCESETDPVITDISPEAFRTLLRYCYYDCLDIEPDLGLTMLYTATKYMLPILEKAARQTVIHQLNSTNIWDICKYSTDVGDKELHNGCMTYLKLNLRSSNMLAILKYAVTIVDKDLRDWCGKYLKENLSPSNILDVTRYVVSIRDKELHDICKMYLKENLCGSNIWEFYKYGVIEGDTEVHQHCMGYFQKDFLTVWQALQSEEFLKVPQRLLLDMLHINNSIDKTVGIGYTHGITISEIELFKACNAWAEAECLRKEIDPAGSNKRTVLGECLSLIRFPIMLQKDLMTVVYPTGILTQAETVSLCQYKHRDPSVFCAVDFPSERRQFLVTLSGSSTGTNISRSTVFVESEVRVIISRLWMWCSGSHIVSLTDEKSVSAVLLKAKHKNHLCGNSDYILPFLDIEPPQMPRWVKSIYSSIHKLREKTSSDNCLKSYVMN